ncbi:hypothetical protein H4R20_002151 [Coemansia guatemalensis]|uniref:Uncharacterized protein n=1 Tax=Coemansia guatemalensis TaxID=2761395 RepID=A0A9W8HVP2_9FUNG|nr:hypothetical protein H4R20_002151 [Coemansia guatemalensis]
MDDMTDQQSEDWSLVHYPSSYSEPQAGTATYSRGRDHMVTAWLDSCRSVSYSPSPDSASSLLISAVHTVPIDLNGTHSPQPQKQCINRTLSAASLADFLNCVEPCRPSFLDRSYSPNHHHRELKNQRQYQKKGQLHRQTKHKGGTEPTDKDYTRCRRYETQFDQSRKRQHSTKTDANGNPMAMGRSSEKSSAEILSHAFHHFAAFHPLDFTSQSEASSNIATLVGGGSSHLGSIYDWPDKSVTSPPSSPGSHDTQHSIGAGFNTLANVWSFFSGVLEDLTRDTTFIN